MSVIKFLRDVTGLFNWSTDENPTTQQEYQQAVQNWQETEKNLVDAVLWQPETEYAVGNIVKTPSTGSQYVLVCTTAGTSGANEPSYSGVVVNDDVTDGTVTWKVSQIVTSNAATVGDTDTPVYLNGGKVTSIGSTLFSKIVTHLASATAASISSLNTSSLFYRMLSWALTASGVQYNFTNSSAWYICFGSLLGGLIIQGGTKSYESLMSEFAITFPIAFTEKGYNMIPAKNTTGLMYYVAHIDSKQTATIKVSSTCGDVGYVVFGR